MAVCNGQRMGAGEDALYSPLAGSIMRTAVQSPVEWRVAFSEWAGALLDQQRGGRYIGHPKATVALCR
jgi:hypothetical protein